MQLPSDSPGIVDVFTDRYLETGVCLSAYCVATAVLVRFEVCAQQWVYTPQHVRTVSTYACTIYS
jgi:hypothetical protein